MGVILNFNPNRQNFEVFFLHGKAASNMSFYPMSKFTDMFVLTYVLTLNNRIGGVMVNMLSSSAVDYGFEPRLGQTKDYNIGICCFSAKYTALRRKSKDWLARNQDNVSEWGDMSICQLLFQ